MILVDKEEDEQAEEDLKRCDDMFYENEEELNHILKEYADKVNLYIPIYQSVVSFPMQSKS